MATGADQQLATHLPAPKTFAPSREDVLSTLSFFFGDPYAKARFDCTRAPALPCVLSCHVLVSAGPFPRSCATTRSITRCAQPFLCVPSIAVCSLTLHVCAHRTYHFPDAFYGQNTKLRETLNNLILKSPQDWPTGVGLPFVRIQGTNVEWDELKFDVRLLQRVPYEGVSRMQTSLRRRHRDRIVRRGIGMVIESDVRRNTTTPPALCLCG